MINKIISVIMSFIISATGFLYTSLNDIVDSVSEAVFGIPYTVESIKSEFFNEIGDSDVVSVDADRGFVEDMVAVFIDGNLSFSQKLSLFANCGGFLVGWCAPADLYVLRYLPMSYNEVMRKCEALESNEGIVFAMPVSTYKTEFNAVPDDPFDEAESSFAWDELNPKGSNWWLEAIQARQAWDYSDCFSKINIGIVDSGFDLDHPELAGKISFPNSKQANRNYPDYHGCHVAGIIGANGNNGVGISGICQNSNLICVDWSPELIQIWHTELAILFGFSALVKAGAKVINFSLGISPSRTSNSKNSLSDIFGPLALSLMMSSLLSKGYDFVAVQAAGNGDYYGDPMNADYNGHFAALDESNIFTGFYGISKSDILDRIIVVASADNRGRGEYIQSDFSNVGSVVSLAAPGGNVYSCSVDGSYEYLSGTSMAAPVVTGVASLVWSVNPSFSGAEVKAIVCNSTEATAKINTETDYFNDVDLMDYPMVNAKLAVEQAIRKTNAAVGTVSGKVVGDAENIIFNGVSHTLFSDGSYSFVASEGSGIAEVLDAQGNQIGAFDIAVAAGTETQISDYVIQGSSEEPII